MSSTSLEHEDSKYVEDIKKNKNKNITYLLHGAESFLRS